MKMETCIVWTGRHKCGMIIMELYTPRHGVKMEKHNARIKISHLSYFILVMEILVVKNGLISRTNGPAAITYYNNGNIRTEKWCKYGKVHRSDGNKLATVIYYENGVIKDLMWYNNGELHRSGGASAKITHFKNGQIETEEWYIDGKLHRPNGGPAYIAYFENGIVKEEKWYKDGKLHRHIVNA